MSGDDVWFAIAVQIRDRRKPWFAGAKRKLASSEAAFLVG